MRFCATAGCSARVERGHCQRHARQKDAARGTARERGYTTAWDAYSRNRLARQPWCVGYPRGTHKPFTVLADVTDHIISARKRPDLFMAPSNHQSLCHDCNKRKAIAEEGGLGR